MSTTSVVNLVEPTSKYTITSTSNDENDIEIGLLITPLF